MKDFKNKVICDDCITVMKEIPDDSVDSCVSDPPYGLSKEPDINEVLTHWLKGDEYEHGGSGFMGKTWDSFVPGPKYWEELYRILKPGAHALIFSGTRTYDLLVIALRMAGFEIRDQMQWIYGNSLPKSMNIGKVIGGKWDGWGTQLKPAHETICLVRKQISHKNIIENVLSVGTGGININGSKIPVDSDGEISTGRWPTNILLQHHCDCKYIGLERDSDANIIRDWDCHFDCPIKILNDQSGFLKSGSNCIRTTDGKFFDHGGLGGAGDIQTTHGDSGGAARFFYCGKASKSEKDMGVDGGNSHPTVKPLKLCRYLVNLITPKGGTVIDPFSGSGSILVAAIQKGFNFIGIDKDEEYCEIAKCRLSAYGDEDVDDSYSMVRVARKINDKSMLQKTFFE